MSEDGAESEALAEDIAAAQVPSAVILQNLAEAGNLERLESEPGDSWRRIRRISTRTITWRSA